MDGGERPEAAGGGASVADAFDADAWADLADALGGEEASALARTLMASSQGHVKSCSAALAQGDLKSARSASHAVKGSAANMAFVGLAAAASAFEQACIAQDAARAQELFSPLEEALRLAEGIVAGFPPAPD